MIRFFISSTFKDMHKERDVIRSSIYPKIREYGLEKGVYVDYRDLRWGIDNKSEWTIENRITEIMRVCFQEIDDCRPHIVAILSDYYGTTHKDPDQMVNLWKEFDAGEEYLPEDRDISLTQWELEYSFLSNSHPETKALCLFKVPPEKTECHFDNEKSEILMGRIQNKSQESDGNLCCANYKTIEDFKTKFIQYACRLIDKEANEKPENDNWVEQELAHSETISKYRSDEFAGRKRYIDVFKDFLISEEKHVLAFWGESGIGKSSLMSRLFYEYDDSFPYERKIIMCGISQKSNSYLSVLIEIIYILDSLLLNHKSKVKENLYSEKEAEEQLEKSLGLLKGTGVKQLIFIDAMDKLSFADSNRIISIFEKNAPEGIKLICSQIEKYKNTDKLTTDVCRVTPMSKSDVRDVLLNRINDAHQKRSVNLDLTINDDGPVVNAIMEKSGSFSPLYLKAVINILKMHVSDRIPEHLIDKKNKRDLYYEMIVNGLPDTVEDISWYAINEAISFVFTDQDNYFADYRETMKDAIGLIALSRFGLRDIDLEYIMTGRTWTNMAFSAVRLFLRDFFRPCYDGCWTFEHDLIKQGILTHLNDGGMMRLRQQMSKRVFSSECHNTELRIKEGLYLSYSLNNVRNAVNVLEEAGNSPNLQYREIVSKELLYILLKEDRELNWYKKIILKDPNCVMGALSGLLEVITGKDYSRRLPAKYAADCFFDVMGIHKKEDLDVWKKKKRLSRLSMAALCSEYVGVSEDRQERNRAVEYSFFPKEIYMNNDIFDELSFDQKIKACRHLDTLLCANNNVLSNNSDEWNKDKNSQSLFVKTYTFDELKEYSEEIIRFLIEKDKEYRVPGDRFGYIRNISQYYSAVKQFNKSIVWKLQFLGDDIEYLFRIFECLEIPFDKSKYEGEFDVFRQAKCNDDFSINEIRFYKHNEIWNEIIEIIRLYKVSHSPEEINNKLSKINGYLQPNRKNSNQEAEICNALSAIANGYRVISYDLNKLVNNSKGNRGCFDLGCLEAGCDSIEASIAIFSSGLVNDDRERFSVYYRGIEIYINRMLIEENLCRKIIQDWGINAISMYIENPAFYGKSDGKNLIKKLAQYNSSVMRYGSDGEYDSYLTKLDELSKTLNV